MDNEFTGFETIKNLKTGDFRDEVLEFDLIFKGSSTVAGKISLSAQYFTGAVGDGIVVCLVPNHRDAALNVSSVADVCTMFMKPVAERGGTSSVSDTSEEGLLREKILHCVEYNTNSRCEMCDVIVDELMTIIKGED